MTESFKISNKPMLVIFLSCFIISLLALIIMYTCVSHGSTYTWTDSSQNQNTIVLGNNNEGLMYTESPTSLVSNSNQRNIVNVNSLKYCIIKGDLYINRSNNGNRYEFLGEINAFEITVDNNYIYTNHTNITIIIIAYSGLLLFGLSTSLVLVVDIVNYLKQKKKIET